MKPIVSIYCSASRPHLWKRVCDSLSENDVEFEIVFVGLGPAPSGMPDNFRFYQSYVKPAQCYHAAALLCEGKYILNIPDDVVYSPHALDLMKNFYEEQRIDNLIVSPKYMLLDGKLHDMESEFGNYYPKIKKGPMPRILFPATSFMKKDLYMDLGGIDARFFGMYWDLDLAMRVYAILGSVKICTDVTLKEIMNAKMCKHKGSYDRKLFQRLWYKPGKKGWKFMRRSKELSMHDGDIDKLLKEEV